MLEKVISALYKKYYYFNSFWDNKTKQKTYAFFPLHSRIVYISSLSLSYFGYKKLWDKILVRSKTIIEKDRIKSGEKTIFT